MYQVCPLQNPANATNRAGFPLSCCPFAAVQGQYTCPASSSTSSQWPSPTPFSHRYRIRDISRPKSPTGQMTCSVTHSSPCCCRTASTTPVFLYACAVVQRVCKLKAFDPGIGPGVTAVLFRNHKILPPIADRPRFVDISHAPFNIIDSNRKLCRTWASAPCHSHFLVSS